MNKTSSYHFTIIVPVYNEEGNIARLEATLAQYLPTCVDAPACVLFVDDGSTDGSAALIGEACRRHDDFFCIRCRHNGGLSAAMKAGIDYVRSPHLGYIDADLQTTPEDFDLLLPHLADHALVTGIRATRHDTAFKRLQSRIANGFRRMMTGDTATDTGCPLKVMRTEAAQAVPFFKGMHRFLPALIGLQPGASFMELPVRHFPRVAGQSKYHLRNRLVGPFADCFAFRWMRSRYISYELIDEDS